MSDKQKVLDALKGGKSLDSVLRDAVKKHGVSVVAAFLHPLVSRWVGRDQLYAILKQYESAPSKPSTPHPTKPSTPASTTGRLVGWDGENYSLIERSPAQIEEAIRVVAGEGYTMIGCHIGGMFPAHEWSAKRGYRTFDPRNYDVRKIYKTNTEKVRDVLLPACEKHGILLDGRFINSNNSIFEPAMSDAYIRECVGTIMENPYALKCIWMGMNEDDNRTDQSTERAIDMAFLNEGLQPSQMIAYRGKNTTGVTYGYTESHPSSVKQVVPHSGGYSFIWRGDNGNYIAEPQGKDWYKYNQPINWNRSVVDDECRRMLASGNSFAVGYGFGTFWNPASVQYYAQRLGL